MTGLLTGIFSGLLVVLLAWLAKTLFLSRRLYLIQPRLFDYSDLASHSKTVELTIFNAGVRSEEEIKVQLSPLFNYTVLASNTAGLTVDKDGIFRVDRLAPKQDATVILTAEGGEFRKEHVIAVSSKETVGRVKSTLQEAQLTPAQNLLITSFILVLMPALGYVVGTMVENSFWPLVKNEWLSSEEIVNFEIVEESISPIARDQRKLKGVDESIQLHGIKRRGDILHLSVAVRNRTGETLTYSARSTTAIEKERDEYFGVVHYIEANVVVGSGQERTVEIEEFIPIKTLPQKITMEYSIRSPAGLLIKKQQLLIRK